MFKFNRSFYIIIDFIISFLSFILIFLFRYSWINFIGIDKREINAQTFLFFTAYSALIIIISISFKIYELNKISEIKESLLSNLFVSLLSMGVFGIIFYFTQIQFARFVFFTGFLIIPFLLSIINKLIFLILKNKKTINIYYIGSTENYKLLSTLILQYNKWFPIKINNIKTKLSKNKLFNINYLIIDTDFKHHKKMQNTIDDLSINGCKIYTLIDIFGYFDQSLPSEIIKNNHFELFSFYKLNSFYNKIIKRIIDIVLSIIFIILLSPLIIIISLLIKLTLKDKIFFYQKRSGLNNKVFNIIKFQTMISDKNNQDDFTTENDKRITKIGKIIRPLHIDEIPQLINILKGDMSFIGPRPERPEIIAKIIKQYPLFKKRLLVKPGLTGWAQVKYSYVNKIKNMNIKLSYDLYYLNNISILLDFKILLYTFETLVFRKGAL